MSLEVLNSRIIGEGFPSSLRDIWLVIVKARVLPNSSKDWLIRLKFGSS